MAGIDITYSIGKCSSKCLIGVSDAELGGALYTRNGKIRPTLLSSTLDTV